MPAPDFEYQSAEPFEILDRPDDPETDPLRLETTLHPSPESHTDADELDHERWAVDQVDEQVNPAWDEWFHVIAGEINVTLDGATTTLGPDEDIEIPAGDPHRHWNPANRPARVRFGARPGLEGAVVFETLYALAQASRCGKDGLPGPLQFAILQDAYPGYFYTTAIPIGVQRAMTRLLAPIGRLAGYDATEARDHAATAE